MTYLFIISVVSLILYIFYCFIEGDEADVGALLILLFLLLSLGFMNIFDTSYKKEAYIASIERDNTIDGHFILGFGSIDGKINYYAYEILSGNAYKLITISGDSIIIENNKQKPKYIEGEKCHKEGLFYFCDEYKKIIVPEGTIKKEFKL